MDNIDREIYRKNTTLYTWRLEKNEKDKLFKQALKENRTANKVLLDALDLYLMVAENYKNIDDFWDKCIENNIF